MMEQTKKSKRIPAPVLACGIVAAGVWWFLTSEPTTTQWIMAALVLFYACVAYLYLSLALPAPNYQMPQQDGDMMVHHVHHQDVEGLDKVISKFWG
ncbi:hypothetical protein [Geomesophilobacter sediminis]|uniref:Uncharacterized protein n=1 Tax=Geomesophilobacter sediminis TaxID=2798584 RepID=A0A8J7M2T5_9BACT|nr:hypothetical protein [Geomesophilobacter sediminis]MBJ6727699.1 hypothetical protein [Geomesophilobacter sediminis]